VMQGPEIFSTRVFWVVLPRNTSTHLQ
jgi:hypothetical protein